MRYSIIFLSYIAWQCSQVQFCSKIVLSLQKSISLLFEQNSHITFRNIKVRQGSLKNVSFLTRKRIQKRTLSLNTYPSTETTSEMEREILKYLSFFLSLFDNFLSFFDIAAGLKMLFMRSRAAARFAGNVFFLF